jgi:hypothetical protein
VIQPATTGDSGCGLDQSLHAFALMSRRCIRCRGRSCLQGDDYSDVITNRARNNIQASLKDLGVDTKYGDGQAIAQSVETSTPELICITANLADSADCTLKETATGVAPGASAETSPSSGVTRSNSSWRTSLPLPPVVEAAERAKAAPRKRQWPAEQGARPTP